MRVRAYQPQDRALIEEWHRAMGFAYKLPDPESSLVVVKLVAEDDQGTPRMAALGRLTSEAYLLADGRGLSPQERWKMFRELHAAAIRAGHDVGMDEVNAFLPPAVTRSFGRRLRRLGWQTWEGQPWACWSRSLEA